MDTFCPVCQEKKQIKKISEYKNNSAVFSLYQCNVCQLQFWHPRQNPGSRWYEDASDYGIKSILTSAVWRGFHKRFFKKYKQFKPGAKILELGCGSGEFIAELKKRGCQVWGVDFDKKAIEVCKEKFGLEKTFALSFEDFFKQQNLPKFDYIIFFEVIEHLDEPLQFVKQVKSLLAPGGKIVLSTPSRDRFFVNWNIWDFPPHHFTRWNKEAVENLFLREGFVIESSEYVERLKMISGAIDGRLRSGLVRKTIDLAPGRQTNVFLGKALFLLGKAKFYIVGGIPALFLFMWGLAVNRKNGDMLIELKENL